MKIRKLFENEVEQVARQCYNSWRDVYPFIVKNMDSQVNGVDFWINIMKEREKYIVEDKSNILALIVFGDAENSMPCIMEIVLIICFSKVNRSTGIAKVLYEKAVEVAADTGKTGIFGIIDVDNYPAVRFAEKQNFVKGDSIPCCVDQVEKVKFYRYNKQI